MRTGLQAPSNGELRGGTRKNRVAIGTQIGAPEDAHPDQGLAKSMIFRRS